MSSELYYLSGAPYAVLQEDLHKYFYEDGQIKTVEPYLQGKLHGEALLYWPNGHLKRKSHFFLGKGHGVDQVWNEEGVLVDEGSYDQGKAIGVHRRWSVGGVLIEELVFLDALSAPVNQYNLRKWDLQGDLRFDAEWTSATEYRERRWDFAQNAWVERLGKWDGERLIYL